MIWPFKQGDAESLKELGNARKAAGDLEGAAEIYRRSLALQPDYLPCLYNLGLVLHELKRVEEAERCFRRVVELDPRDADALMHLGALLDGRSRFEEAEEVHRAVVELRPENAQLHYRLAFARKQIGRIHEAAASYRRALELQPDLAQAHNDLANILQDEGRLDEAIAHYREAVRFAPFSPAAHNNLGSALVRKHALHDAAACLRRAIELQPDFADAHFNLGNLHSILGERDRALGCFDRAHSLHPHHPAYSGYLLSEMQQVCDWSRFDELADRQRRSVFEDRTLPISPFSLLSIPSSRAEQLRCARNYAAWQIQVARRGREPAKFRFDRGARAKLRIGYLSGDFHEHATAHLMAELFELHDRTRFDIVAYSYGPDDRSAMRQRLQRAFDRFVDAAPLSNADAAATIHADGIDILVDLKGYTQHARPEVVALRPAPIQVSFIGYPGTMGADFIDYLIADRVVAPPDHARDYSEKLVYMPGSYQVNDRKRPAGATPARPSLGLPEKAFVFCCFNQAYKILPAMFDVWMRLLERVPESVLWLLESNAWAAQNLRREATARHVDPARLLFAPVLPHAEHLARMSAANLFLDTLPYNAHTTSSDALWVGLPVLTCPGETFASRVAASQLAALGMPELIARSLAEYETLALRLARARSELARLREKLARNRGSALLFDTPHYARSLEAAYEEMWNIWQAGGQPASIAS